MLIFEVIKMNIEHFEKNSDFDAVYKKWVRIITTKQKWIKMQVGSSRRKMYHLTKDGLKLDVKLLCTNLKLKTALNTTLQNMGRLFVYDANDSTFINNKNSLTRYQWFFAPRIA